jgi:hypothetical protein
MIFPFAVLPILFDGVNSVPSPLLTLIAHLLRGSATAISYNANSPHLYTGTLSQTPQYTLVDAKHDSSAGHNP